MLATAYILLGSNIGDRIKMLIDAEALINSEAGYISATSSIYETAAWGNTNQEAFLNKVIKISTPHLPIKLLQVLLASEQKLGRIREEKWGPRSIDLDILYYNSETIQLPELIIPHPEICNRRFTLIPLCEIAAELKHPILQKNNLQLLQQCSDNSKVSLYIDSKT